MSSTSITRSGKVVGSYKAPLSEFVYWPESGRFVVVAPSGARMVSFATEAEAATEATRRTVEWNA